MARIGTFLKHTLNPLTLRAARGKSSPFAIVKHVGRKTGRAYETPKIVQPTDGGLVIELTYGDQVDWYRNVRAAGGCRILFHQVEYVVDGFEPKDAAAGIAAFTPRPAAHPAPAEARALREVPGAPCTVIKTATAAPRRARPLL